MNKEEIEELKDFTIDITDIDELALGLEVCSKKSNMVIQEFADTIIQLQQENQQQNQLLKDKGFIIDKLMEENEKLKDNWNKLKEIVKSQSDFKLKVRNKEIWFEIDELFCEMENWKQDTQKYKEVIDRAINNSQYWIDYYTRLNSDERIALRLQENIDILKEVE